MAIEEEIWRSGRGGSFLHDDYPNIAHVEVDIAIYIVSIGIRRRKNGSGGREGKGLVVVA
jgi:hypothetical protein